MSRTGRAFRLWHYSRWDAVLAAFALLQFALMTTWALAYDRWPWWLHALLVLPAALLFYYNPIVVTHNFLHTPFFAARRLNALFSIFNSGNLLLPQSLYKHHHLLHHRHNNDALVDGTTRDPSSTWRYGRRGRQEHVVAYSALGLLRDSTTVSYRELVRQGDRSLFRAELAAIAATLVLWGFLDWRWLLAVALPVFYLGWFLAHMENYYEHHRATNPQRRHADSVSYLGRLYNRLMFNEGYHQAHHIQPGRHWTARPEIHARFTTEMNAERAYIARFPPVLGFLDPCRSDREVQPQRTPRAQRPVPRDR